MGRIQNNQFGAVVDKGGKFVDIEREVAVFAQMDGHGATTDVMNHGLVDGKTGIRVDDFISLINQRQDRKENNWLTAWDNNYFIAGNSHGAGAADVFGQGLTQVRQAGGGTVVRPAGAQGVDAGVNHVRRRVEIRFADLEMNDAFALTLEGAGFVQNFERSLGTQPRHAAG